MKINAENTATGLQPDSFGSVAESLRLLGQRRSPTGIFDATLLAKSRAGNCKRVALQPMRLTFDSIPHRSANEWAMNRSLPEGKRNLTRRGQATLDASSTRQPNDCPKDNSLFARTCRKRKLALA